MKLVLAVVQDQDSTRLLNDNEITRVNWLQQAF